MKNTTTKIKENTMKLTNIITTPTKIAFLTPVAIFLFTLMMVGTLSAQYIGHDNGSSYTDIFGTTHYNLSNGHSGTSNSDIFGTTHYNFNDGHNGTSNTDIFGTTHYSGW